jgi:hypothetical protein
MSNRSDVYYSDDEEVFQNSPTQANDMDVSEERDENNFEEGDEMGWMQRWLCGDYELLQPIRCIPFENEPSIIAAQHQLFRRESKFSFIC